MAREMKTSRFYWVGNIPSHWKQIKLGYLCSLKGRIGWKGLRSDEFLENSYAYLVTGQDFKGDTVNWEACYQIEKGRYDEDPYIQLREGDLLVTKDGTIGKIAKIRELEKPACLNSGIFVLRQTAKLFNQSYLYWQLNSSLLTDYNMYVNSGASTIQHLYQNVFERMPLLVPPLSEQQAIADFLDGKCAEIDGLLTDLDAEVKTLAEYKKSIIAETVIRGLNPNAPMKSSGIPWIGEIPNHWKIIANKYIMYKKKDIVPVYEGQDIISLSMNGVIVRDLDAGGKMPSTFNGYQHIYPGNLLMCLFDIDVTPRCIGLIKNDGLTSPAYSQFVMDRDAYAPFYYYFYLKMDNDKELVHLSKNMRHSLNEDQFGMIKTIYPPREEQEAIAAYLDEKCATIDQSIADKQTQIETLKSYKSSFIYEYVTGKKQVI